MSPPPRGPLGVIQPMLIFASYIHVNLGLSLLLIAFYTLRYIACLIFLTFFLEKTKKFQENSENNVKYTKVPNIQSRQLFTFYNTLFCFYLNNGEP